jgi:hypothetical protein
MERQRRYWKDDETQIKLTSDTIKIKSKDEHSEIIEFLLLYL